VGAFQTNNAGLADVFVTKLNPAGNGLVFSTYLGGNSLDYGMAIALDPVGDVYVTGEGGSIPTTGGAWQTSNPSSSGLSAFVVKLNSIGTSLIYSTYLGGSVADGGKGIGIDLSGNAYITGYAKSTDFPTTSGAFKTTHSADGSNNDAFVTELNSTGTALNYSTYLGGNSDDRAFGISVDSAGNAYVGGWTNSNDFPTTAGAYQANHAFDGGKYDCFITKLNASGTGLLYSTYFGGDGDDFCNGIAIDSSSNVYVTGETYSTNFPVTGGAYQSVKNLIMDVFLVKLDPLGALDYSTYLGGNHYDEAYGVAVDTIGNVYLTGDTASITFPTTASAYQISNAGDYDVFVTKFDKIAFDTSTPTNTPTITPTSTFTSTPTVTFTSTDTSTFTPTNTPCGYPGNTCTFTNTPTMTITATPILFNYQISKNLFTSNSPILVSVSIYQAYGLFSLKVYNSAGEYITTLDEKELSQPLNKIYSWDGTNKYGKKCSSGVYIIYMASSIGCEISRVVFINQ
jgi:hypothetical protein